ncbi:MAG: histidine ammonia-lyase [Acidobacteria bacterium]|nr:histidine ammonia-lyase [Acidobacteriota bacterium]
MNTIQLDGESLRIHDVVSVAQGGAQAALTDAARERMRASRALVDRFVAEERTVYGITTGFGVFSEVSIPRDKVLELQRRLILSHCAGIGDPFPDDVSRAMMLLRANALAKGCSGIRVEVVETLLAMLNAGYAPVIPSQGSVGASGDLAPLAHLASTLIGEGFVRAGGVNVTAKEALAAIGRTPVALEAKEGLALINGTQAICAMASLALDRAVMLLDVADLVATMTLDALLGTDAAFDPRIHEARPHPGQKLVARRMKELLVGSEMRESHRACKRVQDAYSLRCVPQVHGAVRDAVDFASGKIAIEINSATDNPLIFVEDETVVSGGNFHGAPVAMACDVATLALTDLGSISERRIERLVNPQLSELPPFLVREGGLNSGFMIAQVTAAALVSESKTLSHPASVDSIPTSANKEDHVSMGPTAAWKLGRVVENVATVLAIEAMAAAQAIEFRRPLKSSPRVEGAVATLRSKIAHWESDRYLHDDLVSAVALLPELHAFATTP